MRIKQKKSYRAARSFVTSVDELIKVKLLPLLFWIVYVC